MLRPTPNFLSIATIQLFFIANLSCSATSLLEWRGSWTASLFAGEHGLLLARVSPYEAQYRLSSHRGVDRPFNLGNNPQMHVFVKPDGIISAPRDIQLCCRHEFTLTSQTKMRLLLIRWLLEMQSKISFRAIVFQPELELRYQHAKY